MEKSNIRRPIEPVFENFERRDFFKFKKNLNLPWESRKENYLQSNISDPLRGVSERVSYI